MGLLADIKRKYIDFISLSISSYRDYILLKAENRVALIGSLASIVASVLALTLINIHYRFELALLIAMGGTLLSSYRIVERISKSLERRKGLTEELPYLVFMASVTAKTGTELIEVLTFIAANDNEGRVFKYFSSVSKRLINISKYISIYDALESIAGMPRAVKRIFRSYIAGIAQGVGVESLRSMGAEMIKESSRQISRIIDLSAQGGLLAVMIMTTAPMLILGISSVVGSYIAISTAIMITIATPLIIIAIPATPYPFRQISVLSSRLYMVLKALSLSTLIGLYVIIYIKLLSPTQLLLGGSIIIYFSLLLIVLGLVSIIIFISYIKNIGLIKRLLEAAGSYVRVYRTLAGFDMDRYLRDIKLSFPWILSYIALSVRFLMEKGEIDPYVFNRFSDEIGDILSKSVNKLFSSSIPLASSLLQPIFLSQVVSMMHVGELYMFLLSAVSVLAASLISSKVFFGEVYNTLVPGISMILLLLLMPLRW
ncbi:MAG: hypothetical protein RQ855_00070 [Desulfurococcales archaeon]|nr:hypothetical protein [Desulfurococcales archaeon]